MSSSAQGMRPALGLGRIVAFAELEEEEAKGWKPKVVFVDAANREAMRGEEPPGPQRRVG